MKRIIVLIPTFNESSTIVEQLKKLEVFRIDNKDEIIVLVIDDNSPDGTAQKVSAMQAQNADRLFLEVRTKKAGLGTAYVHGFKWALSKSYDFIFSIINKFLFLNSNL